MNLYVGNLDYKVDEHDLRDIFGEFGSVEDARIIKHKESGRSKGFGFVIMNDNEAAKRAIEELNGAQLEDRDMVVNEAREKSESKNRRRY